MIGQIDSVLWYFGKLPSSVKLKLLYAYVLIVTDSVKSVARHAIICRYDLSVMS